MGSSIYFEDLINGNFIHLDKLPKYLADVIASGFSKKGIHNVIDVDYLMDVEATTKKLDVEKIKKQPIKYFIRALDIEKGGWVYLDGRKDTMEALKATSTCAPLYTRSIKIGKKSYIDGNSVNTRDFLNIIEKNKDKNIIYIINNKKTFFNAILTSPYLLIESILFGLIYGNKLMFKNLFSMFSFLTPRELSKIPNVHVIVNNKRFSKLCTNKEKLLEMYEDGISQTKKILKTIQTK